MPYGQPGYGPSGYGPPPGYGAPLPPPGAYVPAPLRLRPLPPPGYPGQPAPGYYGQPQAPKGSGCGSGLLVAVILLAVVGALGYYSVWKPSLPVDTTAVRPSYTYAPTSSPTTLATTTVPVSTTVKTYSPTATAGPLTGSVAPSLNIPTPTKPAGPQPVIALADNPLFSDAGWGLPNIPCDYPDWSADPAAARAFFEAARTCLDGMWRPILRAANLPFATPNLEVPARAADTSSPCTGSGGSYAAFYCSANSTIYMPLDHIQVELHGDDIEIYLAIFAHEYGHHVQAMSGVTEKSNRDRYRAGQNSALGTELSRRLELEAQCFGGMFIGSSVFEGTLTAAQGQHDLQDNYRRGDSPGDVRDHGTKQHYGLWWEWGYSNNRVQKCNTWNATSDVVS